MKAYNVVAAADAYAVTRLAPPAPDAPLEVPGPLPADVARAILSDVLERPALLHEVVAFEHRFLTDFFGTRAMAKTIPAEDIREWAMLRGFTGIYVP